MTEHTAVNTVAITPGCREYSTGGGGQSDYEKWYSKQKGWSRGLHDSQQRGTGCHDMGKHLGNDEQDTRSLRHREHRLE